MKLNFTKMQGIGNDYVYVNGFNYQLDNPSELAIRLSNRNFGIGSDGLILVLPSDVADCRMQMFNADGSESQMCGNGVRCVGKFAYDHGIATKEVITVETLAGIKTLTMQVEDNVAVGATVDMGEPILATPLIPVLSSSSPMVSQEVVVHDTPYLVTAVSMGNPHAVIFTEGIHYLDLPSIGPLFENHKIFPERVNTEFVEVISPTHLKMRVWERGSGETLACGTGACAVAVAAILNGYCEKNQDILITLKGGDLVIRWDETNHVYMTGAATYVFDGQINL